MIVQKHLALAEKMRWLLYKIETLDDRIKDYTRSIDLYNSTPIWKQAKPETYLQFLQDKLKRSNVLKGYLQRKYALILKELVQDAIPHDFEQDRFIQIAERYKQAS